jgi:hypothetical protein
MGSAGFLVEAYSATEERIYTTCGRKLVNPRSFEEEVSLFREEKRKPGQVDLSLVHFGLGKVGVDGQRGFQARCDAVVEIESDIGGHRDLGSVGETILASA